MLGMYTVEENHLKIGKYKLCKQSDGKIWIQNGTGEGSEFDEDLLAHVINEFYKENF